MAQDARGSAAESSDESSDESATEPATEPADETAILDSSDLNRVLTRISHEILESAKGATDLVVLGIPTRGTLLAHRLAAKLSETEGVPVPSGSLDVTMYRDDLQLRPARALGHTDIPAQGIDGSTVVLVDDVLFSGRTVRAALDAINDIGRPAVVRLAVMVDRGHRQLPIRADHVGKNVDTKLGESVRVRLAEIDGVDEVVLVRNQPDPALTGGLL
ncbi:MAG: bifunctional pyr operon transcriptional regulator/uracil phosphoribosyltransferase PyrR [Actinobacteria bacterium]|nr:bifunctional pyr operon transcriptional regulator/uracil phosphoribosyltransferase PyrR [Actinomycetota bacterium]